MLLFYPTGKRVLNNNIFISRALLLVSIYKAIFNGFGIERECESKVQFFIGFSHFLHTSHDDNKKIVLLVDECHLLSQDMLEDLLILSNIDKGDGKLINILFAGESTFEDMLGLFNDEAEKKVLPLKVELSTLNSNETDESISPTSACPAGKKGRGWLISALLLITLILVGSYFLTPNY